MIKTGVISDTHSQYNKITIPKCDLFIHCGDFDVYHYNYKSSQAVELKSLISWLKKIDAKYKIVIAGNHDRYISTHGKVARAFFEEAGVIYLENETVIIEGKTIFGSPYTPVFGNWSFMKKRGKEMTEVWDKMPDDVDILITHGPPFHILDKTIDCQMAGCVDLAKRINEVKPKYHFFGHIHEGYGNTIYNNTHYYNCSVLDENYKLVHPPTMIDIY